MKYILVVLILSILATQISIAQDDSLCTVIPNEVSFGIGTVHSFEKSLFNLQYDVAGRTNLGIHLGYLRHFSEQWAIGINMYGYFKTIDDIWIVNGGNTSKSSMDFTFLNLAVEGKYFLLRQLVESYLLIQISYSSGSLEHKELGKLNLNGISAGIGGGVGYPIIESIVVSAEAIISAGTAQWKEQPFLNSDGKSFNPFLIAGFVKIAYRFE
ncbi:MAG: DUF3575 domain-containing protein [Ignavibacteriales bacterium]|nr:DUF3575 domain-containing protein [Ignavibacteriales bacterium]